MQIFKHRFFEEYGKYGIEYWGLTAQNEPSGGTESGIFTD